MCQDQTSACQAIPVYCLTIFNLIWAEPLMVLATGNEFSLCSLNGMLPFLFWPEWTLSAVADDLLVHSIICPCALGYVSNANTFSGTA